MTHRLHAAGLVVLAFAVSCGASQPATTVLPPEPVAVAPVLEPPVPEITLVPQHAVRDAVGLGWDPSTHTLVVVSSSGHVVFVDGATGLVRAVDRFARAVSSPSLVVAAGHAVVSYDGSDGEPRTTSIDVAAGASADESYGPSFAIASADGSTLATFSDSSSEGFTVDRIEGGERTSGRCGLDPDQERGLVASLSPDGTLIALATGARVTVLDARDCIVQRVLELPEAPRTLSITNDGTVEGPAGAEAETAPIDPAMPELDYEGGERAVHQAWLRPDAEGILIGQRGSTVAITRDGAHVVDCIDGEQELEWSPLEAGVALQGTEGHCNVGTHEGTLAPPDSSDYGSYYDSEETDGDEEEEEREGTPDESICAPSDPLVCVTFPGRGGPPRLTAGAGARPRALRGVGSDAEVEFSVSARYLHIWSPRSLRIVDVTTGRDRLRTTGSVVDYGPGDHWIITTVGEDDTAFHSLDDTHVAIEVPRRLIAESIVFEATGTSALLCTEGGIERVSLSDGALTTLATSPCRTIRIFRDRAIVSRRGDTDLHAIDLGTGSELIAFSPSARPPPAGSSYFHDCEGEQLVLIDVASGTRRTVLGPGCGRTDMAQDGSYWISGTDFESVTLTRPDGASLELHVIWVDGTPHPYAEAADHAFWVASPDEIAELNVVTRTGDEVTVASAADPEMQRRLYRPTLLADFLDGRPLEPAAP